MLLIGAPAHIFSCLDSLREGFGPHDPHLFRPETVTQFAVRGVFNPQGVEIRLSTQPATDIDDTRFHEIGRVAVLFDQRELDGHCILIVVHDAQLKDEALHRTVADVSLHLTRGAVTDMVFAPMRDLMTTVQGIKRSRVSLYATTDGGVNWQVSDVSGTLDDLLVHGDDTVTVRTGFRTAHMSVTDLLDAIMFERRALNEHEGVLVNPASVLVHFEPPESSDPQPTIAYFDTLTTFTTVVDSEGRESNYEAEHGSLLLNRRAASDGNFPYVGIVQSGNRYFGGPLAASDIYRLNC